MLPINLRTEYERNPLGLGVGKQRFSWQLESEDLNGVQDAYEIEVVTHGEIVWGTGKVDGSAQVLIPYAGPSLKSRQQCSWRVRVWDDDLEPGDWSESSTFEMGLLEVSDWHRSAWITPPENPEGDADRSSPILRREFDISEVGEARLDGNDLGRVHRDRSRPRNTPSHRTVTRLPPTVGECGEQCHVLQ